MVIWAWWIEGVGTHIRRDWLLTYLVLLIFGRIYSIIKKKYWYLIFSWLLLLYKCWEAHNIASMFDKSRWIHVMNFKAIFFYFVEIWRRSKYLARKLISMLKLCTKSLDDPWIIFFTGIAGAVLYLYPSEYKNICQ